MAILILENSNLKVSIKSLGAELCSLINKSTGTEHIWQADPSVWNRHAPILFPIVGQVEKNQYRYQEEDFHMTQHGFARDMEFTVHFQDENSIVFKLESNDSTLKKYPFQFELFITYTLTEDKVDIHYQVVNIDSKSIYFSIGAHPGLVCPFLENESFSDYVLEFEKPETATRHFFADGLLNGLIQVNYINGSKILQLSHDAFKDDAIILEGLKSSFVDLKNTTSGKSLRFYFEKFPLLAFWTKPGMQADFLCIEPWFGVADVKGSGLDFSEKAFIQKLDIDATFSCNYSIQLPG